MDRYCPEEHYHALDTYCCDMTVLARIGTLVPNFGHEKEVKRVFEILTRTYKRNPVLLGEANGDRTLIIKEIIRRFSCGEVPEELASYRLVSLDVEAVVRSTVQRGDFEKHLQAIFRELSIIEPKAILVIENLHQLIRAGRLENCIDSATVLIPALARHRVQIFGTTTLEDYREYLEKDLGLFRHFQGILVQEKS